MLLRHPTIYLGANGAHTTALLVRGGEVVAVGDEALARADGSDEIVEPVGACVFPALCDAHIHLWGLGLRPGSVSLGDARNTEDVYRILEGYDLSHAPGGWVLGRDWDQHHWTDSAELELVRLDAVVGDHPVALRRIDGHALWVNSAALKQAGIAESFEPGPNGYVGRTDGRMNGLLVDDAMNRVLEAIPEPTAAEDRAVFLQSCAMLQDFGCASAHIAWMPIDRLAMLEDLRDAGELPLRLHLFLDGRDDRLDSELSQGPRFDDWLNISGVKYFADGALGSKGAHLHLPYADGSTGLVLETTPHLRERCAALAGAGWQVAVHAIGDAAATSVLDAFEAIDPAERALTRPRMEHCQMLRDDDVERFGELGVVASVQAIHMRSDATWAVDQLSEEQLRRLFRWRELQQVAPCVAGGSDYPIEDPNPWHGIAASSARKDRKGRAFRAEQALSRAEALRSYTEGAAWAGHRETRCGRLDVGFLADFIALDRDPFTSSDEEIWDMQVTGTWIGGLR